jgi:hypothetical protein
MVIVAIIARRAYGVFIGWLSLRLRRWAVILVSRLLYH